MINFNTLISEIEGIKKYTPGLLNEILIQKKAEFLSQIEQYKLGLQIIEGELIKEVQLEASENNESSVELEGEIDKKPTFTIPFQLSTTAEIDEGPVCSSLTEDDLNPKYALGFPPPPLTDSNRNKKLLEIITPELLIYFRMITHPHKQELFPEDRLYLDYLIDIEGWAEDDIKYLITGTMFENQFSHTSFENQYDEATREEYIQKIETYIDRIKRNLEVQARHPDITPRLVPLLTEDAFNLKLNPKEMALDPLLVVSKFKQDMVTFGYIWKPWVMPKSLSFVPTKKE